MTSAVVTLTSGMMSALRLGHVRTRAFPGLSIWDRRVQCPGLGSGGLGSSWFLCVRGGSSRWCFLMKPNFCVFMGGSLALCAQVEKKIRGYLVGEHGDVTPV